MLLVTKGRIRTITIRVRFWNKADINGLKTNVCFRVRADLLPHAIGGCAYLSGPLSNIFCDRQHSVGTNKPVCWTPMLGVVLG